ncbi:MAG: DUF3108 domain-containing protein [Gammaproteobacteria bacterium]|nr:DUF3108 domain-containing protein [Gammaproteobacteria bacterium]
MMIDGADLTTVQTRQCGLLTVLALAAVLAAPSVAAQDIAAEPAAEGSRNAGPLTPRGFVINYDVRFAAFRGDLTLELLETSDNDYRIRATTTGRGLARMFMGKESVEEAHFTFADGQVISRSYELEDGGKSGENDTEIHFDWPENIAHSVYEQELAELPLEEEVYDRISADVVTIMDLRNGNEPRTLKIAEKNSIREYTFEAQGEERIELPSGEVDTVKFMRTRTGSSRSVLIWYAPELDYLPVRMEQFKRGKSQITFTTESYSLAEPLAASDAANETASAQT